LSANRETEWIEFKLNNDDPQEIGEYLSALSNSAALCEKRSGYIVWGVTDSLEVIGTNIRLHSKKVGNEALESWLSQRLSPRLNIRMLDGYVGGIPVSVIEVPAASFTPVRFGEHEYIRVGSYKKKLRDFLEKERELWRTLERRDWETEAAVAHLRGEEVLKLLDYPSYFKLIDKPLPDNVAGILANLISEKLLEFEPTRDSFSITNLGAILFANDLSHFSNLGRKAVRVVIYRDRDRTEALREQVGQLGYASGFSRLIAYLNDLLPANEQITNALRTQVRVYPEIAIRELIGNALIHQDFRITGTGPLIEVFTDRIEITNPGVPLIDTDRFLDLPPQTRNETLGALMRRMNMCEERGSGIDKVIKAVELFQLPAPRFEKAEAHTKATLFALRKLSDMDRDDRVRACYQHACLRYVSNDLMTNTSLRERFAIARVNYSIASRIIGDTMDAGLIKRRDPESRSKKHAKYVPFWA
jgi:predicted HTH transcriptional regulator